MYDQINSVLLLENFKFDLSEETDYALIGKCK